MESHDIDKLLERTFSGDPPASGFRADVLRDSTAALVRARGMRRYGWGAGLGIAAAFLACASFFLGRYSVPAGESQRAARPTVAEASATVAVPSELLEWLDAAQLFRQLGMTDRMARAVERASRLLPRDAVIVGQPPESVFADVESGENSEQPVKLADTSHPSMTTMNRVLARSLGD